MTLTSTLTEEAVQAGLTPEQVRPHLVGYTNPTMMTGALRNLRIQFRRSWECLGESHGPRHCWHFPAFGLVRIQWDGPWTRPGVPVRARYRKTHWIATQLLEPQIRSYNGLNRAVFDVNAVRSGGWICYVDWANRLVPWIVENLVGNGANGGWWPTHCWEVVR